MNDEARKQETTELLDSVVAAVKTLSKATGRDVSDVLQQVSETVARQGRGGPAYNVQC